MPSTKRIFLPNPMFCTQTNKKCYQTRDDLWNFSKISSFQHYPYSFPFSQNYYKHSFYFPSFYHLLRLIFFFPTKKGCGKKYSQDLNKNLSFEKINTLMIWFKEKEKEGDEGRFQLGDQWKVPMLGGQWKVPMIGDQWKEKEKHLFTSSHFPPKKFYLNLHFSFDFKVLFYHRYKLLHISFLFIDL